ncbi:Ycf66 family protein [Nodosilinea sp. E11]|uniref:Ycf66 family protein n=1 Tax=Nodosilinea sp. E11 TaxID=3037479 RepID=UPI002934CDDE|nr:Ycf66 family protein [Nodosilinea sp. E11]WOD40846.1 Ycf66 family protein [Nodosilinea sp. E11]
MGVQVLAIAVWLGSVAVYGAAFFFPEVHRRHDFFWSGVGAFYGLVLWFTAAQTSPTELLGHWASVVLLGWLGWQTLTLRRKRTPLDLQTPLTADSWPTFGRQLKQSVLTLLKATPLGRWLPETDTERPPGDPAIAVSEIRVSSLKDVDYEFVDELTPRSGRAAPATILPVTTAPTDAEVPVSPVPPVRIARSPRPSAPQTAAKPKPAPSAPQPKSIPIGTRLAGLKAWVGEVVKAKTAPKPKRAVIEIPPRPSPLGRKKPKRETIDIPPRPSPLDRSNNPPDREDVPPAETVTIVDAAAVESDAPAAPMAPDNSPMENSAAVSPDAPQTDNTHGPVKATDNATGNSGGNQAETNWDDDETNWLDD